MDAPFAETLTCATSESFVNWLACTRGSVAISTYQAGKLVLVGWNGNQVTVLPRDFQKPMGLAVDADRMALATQHAVILFGNAKLLAAEYLEDQPGRYDSLYLPRVSYLTGDLNVHDVAFAGNDLILVNSRFSCLATPSSEFSFRPFWQPPFISELAPEDRCHLNGVAIRDGRPAYVTALGSTDVVGGWRERKADGGVVLDVSTGDVLVRRCSMPHSPRWHEDRLWILNSGTGELWLVDPATGDRTVVCGLPGYLRGLCFVGRYALVGLSRIREKHIFGGLPIERRHQELKCGVAVVDLKDGRSVAMLEFTAGCTELYDVQFIPAVQRPAIVNLDRPASRQAFTAPTFSYWLRPNAERRR